MQDRDMNTRKTRLTVLDIVHRSEPPVPWDEGDNIPWGNPAFSERMLAEHLSQAHDHASRTELRVDAHVDWIWSDVLGGKPASVLDLACGPGLYTERLAARGCRCVGIDVAPAAIRHAQASAADLECAYACEDVRTAAFGTDVGLVMMLSGQLNVFRREEATDLLLRAFRALSRGGQVLLEVQTHDHVRGDGETRCTWWQAEPSGIFSQDPHLVLQESSWDELSRTRTDRFFVVDADQRSIERHAMSTEAYTEEQICRLLVNTGFADVRVCASLTGEPDPTYPFNLVVTAQKRG